MNNENIIRREQFCQIVGEIKGSHEYLIVGIDVAKDKHHAFTGTAAGTSLLRRLIFEKFQYRVKSLIIFSERACLRTLGLRPREGPVE